jgi:8-oxo-dGTP diphosphatase
MPKVAQKYKFAVIATDVVIFTIYKGALRVLLIQMKKAPFTRKWAVPGGLVRGDESVDQAAQRLLFEKAAVKNVYLEQLYTFGKVTRDPFGRVVSVAYFALVSEEKVTLQTTKEYFSIGWHDVRKLPPLAYDHKEVISLAVERLQNKLEYTNIIYSLMPEKFTLGELQHVYEIILGKSVDKRNFRKKILSLKLVRKLKKKQQGQANRPAELFSFVQRTPRIVEIM